MSVSEFLMIAIVGLCVIPPQQWPRCAYYLTKGLRWIKETQQQAHRLWSALLAQYELEENQRRAKAAEQDTRP